MRSTIDSAGRVVVPKELRADVGLVPGPIDIVTDGAGIRITPIADIDVDDLVEVDGMLLVPASGSAPMSVDDIRDRRLADQR
jgi:AbrB family looped-hinge helix DNA binding protein